MPSLLKNTYDEIEDLKGRKLVVTIVIVFLSFLFIGILIGYLKTPTLNNNETNMVVKKPPEVLLKSFSGVVEYRSPSYYPNDKISFALVDTGGEDIILLKADDDKLEIVEGLFVTVNGKIGKTSTNEQVLNVVEVEINNVTD